jgi:alcohol dehydrogenase YqhD (iron-dependent ADH family)
MQNLISYTEEFSKKLKIATALSDCKTQKEYIMKALEEKVNKDLKVMEVK